MPIEKVVVFGATGAQGKAQVRELLEQGYWVRAVSRNPQALDLDHPALEKFAADYGDQASLTAAVNGMDAVFFQAPALGDNDRLLQHCKHLTDAIASSSVQQTVVNSSMWAPEAPCGEIIYDGVLAMETVFTRSGIPVIVFRPTLYMNNLCGDWVRSSLLGGLYYYPHEAGMLADWIALEDVAKFMVGALAHPELSGRKLRIGGPERLSTLDMLQIVGRTIRRKIDHKFMTPIQFGEFFWDYYGASSGLEKAAYVAGWDSFYTFNNYAPERPFIADSEAVQKLLSVRPRTLSDWASQQTWM